MSHMQRELMDSALVQHGTSGVKSDTAVYTADGCFASTEESHAVAELQIPHRLLPSWRGFASIPQACKERVGGEAYILKEDVGRGHRPVQGRGSVRV